MNEFEYMDAEKKGLDAYTVMARAIRAHYHDDEEKIPPALARIMAKIIDDGFLDSIIAEQAALITHSRRILEDTHRKRREEEQGMYMAKVEKNHIEAEVRILERRREELERLEEQETDPFIIGARKAYLFIESRTSDKEKASKAFNSYLQGIGKWKQYQSEEKQE